jgi:hypothetical protein
MTKPKTDYTGLTDAQFRKCIEACYRRLNILTKENARRGSLAVTTHPSQCEPSIA